MSGRVFSVRDGKPLAGVRVTLAGQSSTTDGSGRFLFAQPPSGYQLITIDHASLEGSRRPLKDGSPGGLMHADPVLVKVSSEQAIDLTDPIWVVQTLPATYAITPGERADVRPSQVPGLTLAIPSGTTITGDDGQPRTRVSVTPVPPDRVPRLPDSAAPRTVISSVLSNMAAAWRTNRCRSSCPTICMPIREAGSPSGITTRCRPRIRPPISGNSRGMAQ